MRRLHCFWRGLIAALCGAACGQGFCCVANHIQMVASGTPANLVYRHQPYGWFSGLGVAAFLFCAAAGVGAYALLTHWFGTRREDDETRCRKCGYILRGITEPRCPECGERI